MIGENQKHRFFNLPHYKIGDVVIIRVGSKDGGISHLKQGVITMAYVEEDEVGVDSFLMGKWHYVIDLRTEVVVKTEDQLLFKLYR